ncbi:MAG TPA: carboxylesterase family protein [Candidatus Limnocylindrales bacterium]|nr:carboxylesterase family protein [Candidatus Limnocylindrales bacterium]
MTPKTSSDVVVATAQGRLRGRMDRGVASFKGVPYAAPPFGRHRFGPPQPAKSWSGVREAQAYGAVAPQTPYPSPVSELLGDQGLVGEDCLNLNVWTPDPATSGLPVMVWIPGGAFARGSGALPVYDGARFAQDGVICVTINYRLGCDGFLWFSPGTPNRGLLDQVAALEWVQQNIAAFGGDPSRVTLFGESAGAFSIGALLAMPRARGLFRRAILQSGAAHHTISPETASMVLRNLAGALGVAGTPDAIAAVPIDRLLQTQTALAGELALKPDPSRWGETAANAMMFEPVVDGTVLPGRPIERIAAGAAAGIELMAGWTAEEFRFFLVPSGIIDRVTEPALRATTAALGLSPDGLSVYRAARPGASPGELLAAVLTDWFFKVPAIRLAEAQAGSGGVTYLYEFAWRSPLFDERLGACHAIELGFVFDNLAAATTMTGPQAPQTLADRMHRDWVAFAQGVDPGWPAYLESRRGIMRYDERGGTLVMDPAADARRVWDGIR